MFCKNCGEKISENLLFCPSCGISLIPSANNVSQTPNNATPNFTPPVPPKTPNSTLPVPPEKPKKNGAKIAIISAIIAVVLIAITAVVILVLNNNSEPASNDDTEKEKSSESYVEELENYLDFIAEKKTDVDTFISDFYMGYYDFSLYSGKEADEIHAMMLKYEFEQEQEYYDMGYYYGSFDYDNWEEYVEESSIESFYRDMERGYGDDWEFTYEIVEKRELPEAKLDAFQDDWEDAIEYVYEDSYIASNISKKKDKEKLEDFVDSIEDLDVEKGYGVTVKMVVDGDDESSEEVVEYYVVKIGEQWVIIDGPGFYDAFPMKW